VRSVLAVRPLSRNALVIRNVAHCILQHQHVPPFTTYTDEDFRACVTKLCYLAMVNHHFQDNLDAYIKPDNVEDPNGVISSEYFNRQLLSAAAFFGIMSVVQNLCDRGFYHCRYL
jgi:hypothetical protein